MGAAPPPVQTVSHISVSITGTNISGVDADAMNNLLFSACAAPSWSIEAPKHVFHGKDGKPESIISAVTNPSYTPMQLTQGWDQNHVLASWMNKISDPSVAIDDKKATVTVQFLDSTGQPLFQWYADKALLTGFSHTASAADSNGVLLIQATIDADTWVLAGPGSTDPL
jgi:hypothetical protein